KLYIEGALQTRKWQDQTGNDRYSTEVVLQGFGSTLTMLDGRGEGGGERRGGGGGDFGGGGGGNYGGGSSNYDDYGSSQSSAPSSGGGRSSGGSLSRDMDDDIPF